MIRNISRVDKIILEIDTALRTLVSPKHRASLRPSPGQDIVDMALTVNEKRQVAGLMRINHAGEVCAQALYQGQALTAKLTDVKKQMTLAAAEEVDHLAWCEQRLDELDSHPSYLNPLWYLGSLMIGSLAGLIGDKFSLGFVAETEYQVSAHIQQHLQKLPINDLKTKKILKQMYEDEACHAEVAKQAGATQLPAYIKQLMRYVAQIMTRTSYYL